MMLPMVALSDVPWLRSGPVCVRGGNRGVGDLAGAEGRWRVIGAGLAVGVLIDYWENVCAGMLGARLGDE